MADAWIGIWQKKTVSKSGQITATTLTRSSASSAWTGAEGGSVRMISVAHADMADLHKRTDDAPQSSASSRFWSERRAERPAAGARSLQRLHEYRPGRP